MFFQRSGVFWLFLPVRKSKQIPFKKPSAKKARPKWKQIKESWPQMEADQKSVAPPCSAFME